MKLTIKQWDMIDRLVRGNYIKKAREYEEAFGSLLDQGFDEWEAAADERVQRLNQRKEKAYDLLQALENQTI